MHRAESEDQSGTSVLDESGNDDAYGALVALPPRSIGESQERAVNPCGSPAADRRPDALQDPCRPAPRTEDPGDAWSPPALGFDRLGLSLCPVLSFRSK